MRKKGLYLLGRSNLYLQVITCNQAMRAKRVKLSNIKVRKAMTVENCRNFYEKFVNMCVALKGCLCLLFFYEMGK